MKKDQKVSFLNGEGDEWFERNFLHSGKKDMDKDLALNCLRAFVHELDSVLEVGCADGWRLNEIKKLSPTVQCHGLDPSEKAIRAGIERYKGLNLFVGTADYLVVDDQSVDLLIAGFCLYLCDRNDLFRIACEFDRVLKPGGRLLITDFISPFPYRNRYHHDPGMYSYKMDYADMFLWNPQYLLLKKEVVDYHSGKMDIENPDDAIGISLIQKLNEGIYPIQPCFE